MYIYIYVYIYYIYTYILYIYIYIVYMDSHKIYVPNHQPIPIFLAASSGGNHHRTGEAPFVGSVGCAHAVPIRIGLIWLNGI